ERRTARSDDTPVALELDASVAPAEMLGHPLHGDIRPTRHVVVQADGLALQASQTRGWGHLEIHSVGSGGHDLHLHAVFPHGCSTGTVRGFCGSASGYRMVLSIVGAATIVKGLSLASMVAAVPLIPP